MQATKKIIFAHLSSLYSNQELESISKLIFEKVLGLSRLQIHLNQHETISAANLAQIKEIIARLSHFEPIQYVLGETEFYGLKIKVDQNVLIPRPETEELVNWIINDYRNLAPSVLDIGTGSGCIPISLMKNLPGATAQGWDISTGALMLAKENAENSHVKVGFYFADMLRQIFPKSEEKFDIIVSNPPYVTESEQTVMQKNVTDFEPHIALFVPDEDALIFYHAIADMAVNRLKPGGSIYFEINEKFGLATQKLLISKGFTNTILRKDINGKDRMVKANLDDRVKMQASQ